MADRYPPRASNGARHQQLPEEVASYVRELFISGKTVESHVSSVLRKLQLSSRHQLTRWATERRLT